MPFPGTVQSGGSRIDVTTLTPFTGEASITGTGAFVTLLNVTGKGYLESFYGFQNSATAGFQIRVTVDGVVKILLGNALQNNVIGLITKKDLFQSSTAGTNALRNPTNTQSQVANVPTTSTGFKTYPITDGSDGVVLLGDAKIYFYNSLILEISSAATAPKYHYTGAYKS